MRYYSIYDLVGVQVSDAYPWCETLFLSQGVAEDGETAYQACQQKIYVDYAKALPMEDVRFIGDGAYIGQNIYVDEQYGVRVEKRADGLRLLATQECNEWLVIAVQLALLNCNHSLIHAAALEKNGEVLMFPSWGGVGKTATVCRFIREYGWRLLGDDLVIIGEGRVLPFLKPFVIYPYHKDLFPELFNNGENHTVKNLTLSNMMSRMIPGVKRALRPFPRVLAFLRKHNPQSMRVAPRNIFAEKQLSKGGTPCRLVWLERSMKADICCSDITPNELASKAVSVSCVELFSSKLESVYHMCGCGMLTFDDVFLRMHQIILKTAETAPCGFLEIPASVSITEIGEIIHQHLKNA